MTADPVDRLAERLGIGSRYTDQQGVVRVVPEMTKRALLGAFGFAIKDARDAESALRALDQRVAARHVEPVTVLRQDELPGAVLVTYPAADIRNSVRWRLREENGTEHIGETQLDALMLCDSVEIGTNVYERRALPTPAKLPLGYHVLEVQIGANDRPVEQTVLIIVPRRAFMPDILARGERLWGISVQLYALRSSRNWGIGDFTDLRAVLIWAGENGIAAIGVNPLHALFLDDPRHISPYSPSSRHFLNPLYIDVEAIEELASCEPAQRLIASQPFKCELDRLRSGDLVDYSAVTALKRLVLEMLYQSFRTRGDGTNSRRRFAEFRRAQGEALERFAVFQVLRETFGARDTSLRDWRRWPPGLRDPASREVAAFAERHLDRVEFFAYLQWQAAVQLQDCLAAADATRMPVGLYLDLAVGTDAAGADAWSAPDLVASGATIGAPPDPWSHRGQNWGLPPLNTAALRQQAFQPFAALLRANMQWAGALRIDHILGLMRLFWIPEGARPTEGAYVAYPFSELVGIVALESERNNCLVIGEDLGTLPEGFQAAIRDAGILSCCLLYFERDCAGRFRAPSEYPRDALVSITTHDLPTLWGYWAGHDIDLRAATGAYPNSEAIDQARRGRTEERARLVEALRHEGLIAADHPLDAVPYEAILRFIARTRCRMLMVGLEDLIGVHEQANLPGTMDEYPNWRRRLPLDLDAIRSNARVMAAIHILNAERQPSWLSVDGT